MEYSKRAVKLLLLFSMLLHTKTTNTNSSNASKRFKNPIHENIWAVYKERESPRKSFEIFTKLLKTNKYAYKRLITFLHKTQNFDKIKEMIPLIKSSFPEALLSEPDVGFILAHALARSKTRMCGKCNAHQQAFPIMYSQQAMDLLTPLSRKFPTHQQVASLITTLYDLNNDPLNALAVSERYLNNSATRPTDFVFYFKNATRHLKLGKQAKALDSAKKCLEVQPRFVPALILSVNLNDQTGDTEEAIKNCKAALEITGPHKMLEFMLIRLFFKLKKAQHKISEFVLNKTCMERAIGLLREKKHDQALQYIDECLSKEIKPGNNNQQTLKIKVVS